MNSNVISQGWTHGNSGKALDVLLTQIRDALNSQRSFVQLLGVFRVDTIAPGYSRASGIPLQATDANAPNTIVAPYSGCITGISIETWDFPTVGYISVFGNAFDNVTSVRTSTQAVTILPTSSNVDASLILTDVITFNAGDELFMTAETPLTLLPAATINVNAYMMVHWNTGKQP